MERSHLVYECRKQGVNWHKFTSVQFRSVTQSCPTLCDSMDWTGLPVARQDSLSITNSWSLLKLMSVELVMPSNHLIPVSSCLQSFPASGSFPVSQFFASDGQNIGVSASTSVLPMNIQDWFPWGLTGWISLQSKGLSSLLQHQSSKALILQCSAVFIVQLSHPCMSTGNTIALTIQSFIGKVMSLLFNTLSRFVIAFLPRSKHF